MTGTTESGARGVFMFVVPEKENENELSDSVERKAGPVLQPAEHPVPSSASPGAALLLGLLWLASSSIGQAASFAPVYGFPSQPLSLEDAINVALVQNPNILRAKKDVEASQGIVMQTRAIAIPRVVITGNFNAAQPGDVDIISLNNIPNVPKGLTIGTSQNWDSQIKLVQSIYEGGRIMSSLRSARLTKQQSMLNYRTVVADTVLSIALAYYDVLLARQQITVQEASVELLTRELSDTKRRFDAGTVPRFNVLRAEVELANARPRLFRARNDFRIAKNNLANLLGFNVPKDTVEDIPLELAGKLEATPYEIELQRAVALALERRTELGSLRKAQALRYEDVVSAKAGYKPSVQAFGGYDVNSSKLHDDLSFENHGWITGVQVTWNLFDGFATQGRVKEATARYERAGVDLDDAGRRIELEVRTAHSNFLEAREVLESQKKVVEQAEEALRLASSRFEAGTGTQLDVLSAQTALTEARSTEVQALHDYSVARARLERAVGAITPQTAGEGR